jgi:hypothetical protein
MYRFLQTRIRVAALFYLFRFPTSIVVVAAGGEWFMYSRHGLDMAPSRRKSQVDSSIHFPSLATQFRHEPILLVLFAAAGAATKPVFVTGGDHQKELVAVSPVVHNS